METLKRSTEGDDALDHSGKKQKVESVAEPEETVDSTENGETVEGNVSDDEPDVERTAAHDEEEQDKGDGETAHHPVPETTENIQRHLSEAIENNSKGGSINASSNEELAKEENEDGDSKEDKEGKDETNDQAIDPVFGESSATAAVDVGETATDTSNPSINQTQDVTVLTEAALATKSNVDPETLRNIKKMNHKEVERRRRETINNAIRELQELVPTTHTNKAQIIRKASEFIKKLKEKEENLVNKWTLEKIITDQAINELANSNEKLKSELEKAYREIEHRKNAFDNLTSMLEKQPNSDEVQGFLAKTDELFVDENDHGNEMEDEQQEEMVHQQDNEQGDEQETDIATEKITETESGNELEAENQAAEQTKSPEDQNSGHAEDDENEDNDEHIMKNVEDEDASVSETMPTKQD